MVLLNIVENRLPVENWWWFKYSDLEFSLAPKLGESYYINSNNSTNSNCHCKSFIGMNHCVGIILIWAMLMKF